MTKAAPISAIFVGVLLIVLGVLGRVLTGTSSITALIPAFFGLPIVVLGGVALAPQRWRWSMSVMAVLAFLGAFANFSVVIDLVAVLQGGALSAGTTSRGLMLLLCTLLLVVCGIALMQARPQPSDALEKMEIHDDS